jgi:hypothetical protein
VILGGPQPGQRAIVSQIGPLARTVRDVALTLEILNGPNVEPPLPLGDYQQKFSESLDRASIDLILAPACPLRLSDTAQARIWGRLGAMPSCTTWWDIRPVLSRSPVDASEEGSRRPSRDVAEKAAFMTDMASAGLPVGVQVVARPA